MLSKINVEKILNNILNDPKVQEEDKRLKIEGQKEYNEFKKNHLEEEYRKATLKAFQIEQEMK